MKKLLDWLKKVTRSEFDREMEEATKTARKIASETVALAKSKGVLFLNGENFYIFDTNKCYHEKLGIFEVTCVELLNLCKIL